MSKIYTRGGDTGSAQLFSGERLSKGHARFSALGAVDEANAAIGLVVAESAELPAALKQEFETELREIQNRLFDLGSWLGVGNTSGKDATKSQIQLPTLTQEHVQHLESKIDSYNAQLKPLKNFILPGGSKASAQLHLARAISRRAERAIVALNDALKESQGEVPPLILQYINRLSDFLFTLARFAQHSLGQADVLWRK